MIGGNLNKSRLSLLVALLLVFGGTLFLFTDQERAGAWLHQITKSETASKEPLRLSPEERFALLQQKAEAGDAAAQYKLGFAYNSGRNIEIDKEKAVKYYRLAAESGHKNAQFNLAHHYLTGEGVEKDLDEAKAWYKRAEENGHVGAYGGLGYIAFQKGNEEEAVKWYKAGHEGGDAKASIELGRIYMHGFGVPKDRAKAIQLFLGALDKVSNSDVEYFIGYSYFVGTDLPQNYNKASEYFQRAFKNNHNPAGQFLAFQYSMGYGVEQNISEAIKLWIASTVDGVHPDFLEFRTAFKRTLCKKAPESKSCQEFNHQ